MTTPTITDRIHDAAEHLRLAIDALDGAAGLAREDAMGTAGQPGMEERESIAWLAAKAAQIAAAKAREAREVLL